jgi:hypothetical protein
MGDGPCRLRACAASPLNVSCCTGSTVFFPAPSWTMCGRQTPIGGAMPPAIATANPSAIRLNAR